MAILEKIRKRTVFLIAIIGLALFAFVISGVIDKSVFNSQPTEIGSVNGEEIPIATFRQQVDYATRSGQGITTSQAVNFVWNQNVRNLILNQQFDKLGISIGKDEILNVVAQNPQIAQNPQFLNSAGIFDKNKFVDYIASLKATNPQGFAQWQMQEESIIENAKQQVYFGLILGGLGVTKVESEMAFREETDKADIDFVMLPYSSIADDEVKVTDSEIKSYINSHKKEFEREASRNVQYVIVSEQPSTEDKDAIKNQILKLLNPSAEYNNTTGVTDTIAGFLGTNDMQLFLEKNSDMPYDTLYVAKENLPAGEADKLFNLSKGEIYGPYEDNGYYKISKLMDKKEDAEVKASHILIAYKGSQASNPNTTLTKGEAEAKAKEVLSEARAEGADFSALAQKYSDGPTATRGGDLGYFQKGMMVPEFENFVYANKTGSIGLVETDFGYHIVKVTDKRAVAKFATLARKIEASQNTIDNAYTEATKFEMEAVDASDKFDETAQKMGLKVLRADNLHENDEFVAGLGNNRALVQWTFDKATKVGAIKRFNTNDGYVIAQLTKKNKKGLASVEEAMPYVRPILVKEKKAEMLLKKVGSNDLNSVASSNQTEVKSATGLTMKSPIIIGVGREPKVIGVAFSLGKGNVSQPIIGENGVYVVKVTNFEQAPEPSDYKSYAQGLRVLRGSNVFQEVYQSLEESADIKDNRSTFYLLFYKKLAYICTKLFFY